MADAEVVFFRYQDARGNDVITNELEQVPPELRSQVELVSVSDPSPREQALADAQARLSAARGALGAPAIFHGPSFVLGAVIAFATAYLAFGMREGNRRLLRSVVVGVGVLALGGLYFGWVLRTAGLDHGAVASPRAAIEEARRARTQAEARAQQLRAVEDATERER